MVGTAAGLGDLGDRGSCGTGDSAGLPGHLVSQGLDICGIIESGLDNLKDAERSGFFYFTTTCVVDKRPQQIVAHLRLSRPAEGALAGDFCL